MKYSACTLALFVALLSSGCASPSLSVVVFRSPPGSELSFEGEEGPGAERVVFPGRLSLTQFASEGDEEKRAVKGTLRVNQLVEEERIPSRMRGLLVEGEGGVDVRVKGFYRVYERPSDGDAEASLDTFAVDLGRDQLLRVLTGEGVKVTVGDPVAFELLLGLDLRD